MLEQGLIMYENVAASDGESLFAGVPSVLAMAYSDTQPRGTELQPLRLKIPHNTCFKYHQMLYSLVTAMFPSFLITLDEELNNKPVTGNRERSPWFQMHQTPVRLVMTEWAEIATEEFIPFGHVLESFVILQKNPGWETEDKMEV
ncbi:hypothetical protein C8R45DRAFT_1170657 [Mycena sanguinolenta]|nr:hypothetical protein C8R45DRAFT_1170657 [Mycena sanguinolenta]